MDKKKRLEREIDILNESSKTVRNTYLSYIFGTTVIFLTLESVTHEHFVNSQLKLVLLGVPLQTKGLYFAAPIILLLIHLYFLLHVSQFAGQLKDAQNKFKKKMRWWLDILHVSMFSTSFLKREKNLGWLSLFWMRFIVFLSFFCYPPFIIAHAGINYLPNKDSFFTGYHQSVFILSLLLSISFFIRLELLRIKMKELQTRPRKKGPIKHLFSAVFYFVLFLSMLGAVPVMGFWVSSVISLPVKNFEFVEDCIKHPLFKSYEFFNVFNHEGEEGKKINFKGCVWKFNFFAPVMQAKNAYLFERDLSYSVFFGANFESAFLAKSNLSNSILLSSTLENSFLQNTVLIGTDLQDTNLQGANLEGANLERANLERASLRRANLQYTNLYNAKLKGANLQDANLERANLQEAYLKGAYLEGAKFTEEIRGGIKPFSSDAQNLTCEQVLGARFDITTVFPTYLKVKKNKNEKWECNKVKPKEKNEKEIGEEKN